MLVDVVDVTVTLDFDAIIVVLLSLLLFSLLLSLLSLFWLFRRCFVVVLPLLLPWLVVV
jgi:hypothetical protein